MSLADLFRPYPVLKRGLVNLKSGTVFNALIFKQAGPYLVLRQAQLLQDRGAAVKGATPADGEVLVDRREVDFIQLVSPERLGK